MAKKRAPAPRPQPIPTAPKAIPASAAWPATNPSTRSLAELIPYARNARTHTREQIEKIVASIREWGWTIPVLIAEDNGIIAGHGRVLAAQQLGMTEVPVIVAKGWTDAQRRAYVVADNRLALESGWDRSMLAAEFGELAQLDFNLELTGFGGREIQGLLSLFEHKQGDVNDPGALEPPTNPTTRMGDMWICGQHRLLRGDSTKFEDVKRLMAGDRATCVSGTQIIAAEKTGRRCRAMEISPAFVDASVRRWEQATGKQATLDGDGRTFTEVAAERAAEAVVPA